MPPTVAVIGCGPGGMFFLHALETKRRELEAKGDTEGLEKLPEVTCFERSNAPGGVWRTKRQFHNSEQQDQSQQSSSPELEEKKIVEPLEDCSLSADPKRGDRETCMYEALWTNGPKECIEFFDYTYQDHFGHGLPVYMPRQPLLEYMTARVTRHAPTLFENHVKFNTTVQSVKYDKSRSQFTIVTLDNSSRQGVTTTGHYDKCIWAAGENGGRNMPKEITSILDGTNNDNNDGGGYRFKGKYMHSSAVDSNFEADVKSKRVLMIGANYSAEDLALVAIKIGVEKVIMLDRSGSSLSSYVKQWPKDKVEVLSETAVSGVSKEDGYTILCKKLDYSTADEKYHPIEGSEFDIGHIDTIIFCTGYKRNMSMLEESLRQPFDNEPAPVKMPDGWKMKPDALTPEIGDVTPEGGVGYNSWHVRPGVYDGMLISNPSMMYFLQVTDFPLTEIDIFAWLFLSYITGETPIPSAEEMNQTNDRQTIQEMDLYGLRYYMDNSYYSAIKALYANDEDHWICDVHDSRTDELSRDVCRHWMRLLGERIRRAKYPIDYLGTDSDQLNEKARQLVDFNFQSGYERYMQDEAGKSWKTFRDVKEPETFWSIFTGHKSIPLACHWLDLDDTDKDLLTKQANNRSN